MEPNIVNRKRIFSNPLFKTTFLDRKKSMGDVPDSYSMENLFPNKKPELKDSLDLDDDGLSIDEKDSSNGEEIVDTNKATDIHLRDNEFDENIYQKEVVTQERSTKTKPKLLIHRKSASKPTISLFKKEHFYQIGNNADDDDNALDNLEEEQYLHNMKIQSKINKIMSSSSVTPINRSQLSIQPLSNKSSNADASRDREQVNMPLYTAIFVVVSILAGFFLQYSSSLLLYMKKTIDDVLTKLWKHVTKEKFYKKKMNIVGFVMCVPLVITVFFFYSSFWILYIMNKALLSDISFNFMKRVSGAELWNFCK